MEKIRIGLIGAGGNTRSRHIPGFQAIESVEIVCVANRSAESGRKAADEFGIGRVHGHWIDVIGDTQVDAVCIGTWPHLHAATTCAALEAGKHVLCEARMAANTDEARQMLQAAQQSGLVAMLVPSPFGLKGDRVMRELIAAGYLGQVRELCVRALSDGLIHASVPLHWRQREDLSGVNIMALGILNETVQRWFGRTESVMAQTSVFAPRRPDPETGDLQDVDIPDSLAVVARMATGAQCVYHLSGQAPHGGSMRLEAYGSEGALIYDLGDDTIMGAKVGDKQLSPIDIPADKAGTSQVEEDFVEAIRNGRPVTMTSFADGLKYMRFTEAVRVSADQGRRVCLSEV
ncbi:MAG TPA: Gfo/Idh/MocA family oxidoreductase [Phycisphaerae bacterium]|nr:Gfo/Idh/MocA family oxidoreductase [Phycisphaerae bacterium]